MKRCDNCGYENQASAGRCEKCGARLGASAPPPSQEAESPPPPDGSKKTVKGKASSLPFLDQASDAPSTFDAPPGACSKCGYPLREEMSSCPNCGFSTKTAAKHSGNKNPGGKKTLAISDFEGFGEATPSFELRDEKQDRNIPFQGKEITLKRENVAPDSMSISGEAHARIHYKDGKWLVEDLSSNGATFLQVTRELEIKDGDMLILGQKVFRFKEK